MSDLGTLGGRVSSASAINTRGQVVGYATDTNELASAFLYNGSTLVNLSDLIPAGSGWTNLASADAINDAGQIAGSGYLADGSYHAYLLSLAPPLIVTITNPAPNATFQAPATFPVSASVSDTAGPITNVQFLVNGSVIGNATSVPYSATASSLAAGTYALTAIASDLAGLNATNTITVLVTNALLPAISISTPTFTGSNFSFSFGTQIGYTYEGEFTSPLAATNNWVVFTNVAGDGSVVWVTDWSLTNGQRFYRVVAH
jgi:probable HAF family extracellular repeat protein